MSVDETTVTEEQATEETEEVKDPVQEFDKTANLRLEALLLVDSVLEKAKKGSKTDRKAMIMALTGLRSCLGNLDWLVRAQLYDLAKTIEGVAFARQELFQLSIQVATMLELFKINGVITEEAFLKVFNEVVKPQIRGSKDSDTTDPEPVAEEPVAEPVVVLTGTEE